MLTQKRLKEVLKYDPETGLFTRKIRTSNSINVGDKAGCQSAESGYVLIRVGNILYGGHQLAWVYIHGYFPENQIDHINRIRHDNRIENLREVSQSCNMRNTGIMKTNTSGVKGVTFCIEKNKWQAQIGVQCKNRSVGRYKEFSDAVCARLAAEQCLNWEGCDSSSPAYQYVQRMLNEIKE